MTDRNSILDALFGLITSGQAFKTTGRRLRFWNESGLQLPALFLRSTGETWDARPTGLPPKITMDAEIWIFALAADGNSTATIALDDLIGSVVATLEPAPMFVGQTLGGLVQHAWIEGRIDKDPGDIDGFGKAVIPIKILVP